MKNKEEASHRLDMRPEEGTKRKAGMLPRYGLHKDAMDKNSRL